MSLDGATLSVLRRTPIISLFEEPALQIIANVADERRLGAGEVLFRRGERSDGGYVVVSGVLEVGHHEGEHDTVLGPASLVGQIALFVRMQRPATAVARDPSTVIRISPTLMRRVLQQFPVAAAAMAQAIAVDAEAIRYGLDRVHRLFAEIEPG